MYPDEMTPAEQAEVNQEIAILDRSLRQMQDERNALWRKTLRNATAKCDRCGTSYTTIVETGTKIGDLSTSDECDGCDPWRQSVNVEFPYRIVAIA